jgi:hypothetical protein
VAILVDSCVSVQLCSVHDASFGCYSTVIEDVAIRLH